MSARILHGGGWRPHKVVEIWVATCTKLATWTKTDTDGDYVSFELDWPIIHSDHVHFSVAQIRQKHWLLYFLAIVEENHSLQISTRTLAPSSTIAMKYSCQCLQES